MKKNYKTLFGVLTITVVTLAGSQIAVKAYQGDYTKQGPNYSKERHEAITQAFNNNDYSAWKEQMDGRGRVTEVITTDNFEQFKEAHRLALAGDIAGADTIRAELGLRTSNGKRGGHGHGKGDEKGGRNAEHHGQNKSGNFVDKDGDGVCDKAN